jgi:hypothetical protein
MTNAEERLRLTRRMQFPAQAVGNGRTILRDKAKIRTDVRKGCQKAAFLFYAAQIRRVKWGLI